MGVLCRQMLFLCSVHFFSLMEDAILAMLLLVHLILRMILFYLQWNTSQLKVSLPSMVSDLSCVNATLMMRFSLNCCLSQFLQCQL